MSGLLGDPTADSGGFDPSDIALLSLLATQSDPADGSAPATAAPPDATIAPTSTVPPGATMADTSGGGGDFWKSAGNVASEIGLALGGGIDPSITGEPRSIAGQRALLSFGLNMLMNSGPSYTPRNFGQILATGLEGASDSNVQTEQNRIKAQQVAATYALKAGQMKIAEYLAAAKGGKGFQGMAEKSAVSNLAAGGGGAPGAPATGTTTTPPAASTADFVTSNAPVFQDVAARTGLPPEFVAGQAGNESGWGTSPAATQGNNLFGLSDDSGKPLAFPTKQAGVDAYVQLLNGKYANVPRTGSAADIGAALGAAGYNRAVPDYGTRIGAAAAMAAPLLPQPTTTGPTATPGASAPGGTMAAPVNDPNLGPIAPAPSGTPASPGTGVFGPGSPGWQTLPPAVLPDVAARTADIEDTYQRQMKIAQASGDQAQMAKATQDRLANLATLKQDVTTAQQAQQKAEIEHNAQVVQQAKEQAAQDARNAATIQGQKDVEAMKGQQAQTLASITAGNTWHQRLQEQGAQIAQDNTLKPMAEQAAKAHQMNLGLAQMAPMLQDLPPGGGTLGFVLADHPDLAPLFDAAGITSDKQTDAVRLINGLASNISTQMKPAGLGALREYEWNGFKAQLPNLLATPAGQQKALSVLMNMNNRIGDESAWMNSYFNRPVPDNTPNAAPGATMPAHNLETTGGLTAQQLMDKTLGPIIPSYTGPQSGTGQAQWEQALPPGKPYYKTWAVPDPKNPGQPKRDASGAPVTTKTLEYRPW